MTNPWLLKNPNADEPCGAVDPQAAVPEHVHFDCKECKRIVRDLLASRTGVVDGSLSEQLDLFDLRPKRKPTEGT